MTGTVVSLEGGFRRDRFYLDAAVASTDIDFDSVNRESSLGTATRTNAGQTAGDGFAWEMFSGYRVYRENGVSVTPFAGLRYQDVELDAYTEKEGDSTAMAFAAQERESFLGMAGVTLDYLRETAAGPMRFSGSLRYESEFEDDARSLEAGLTTLPGSRFEMPGYEPESGALNLALAAQATLPRRWEGRVDFSMRSSDAGDRWGFGVGLLKTL
jgi:outer membrane lipase/esterase